MRTHPRPTILLTCFVLLVAAGTVACRGPAGPAPASTKPTLTPALFEDPAPTPTPSLDAVPAPTPGDAASCPAPVDIRLPIERPTFQAFAEVIAVFLSDGVSPGILRDGLQAWDAIGRLGGGVGVADLTGDGVDEVIVAVVDPLAVTEVSAPGNVWVYGCDEGAYHLLYDAAAVLGLRPERPVLVALEDLTGSGINALVYTTTACGAHTCNLGFDALEFVPETGGFRSLLAEPVEGVPSGVLAIQDVDNDGSQELLVDAGLIGSAGAGPQRATRDIYMWDGAIYALAGTTPTSPPELWFPIHYIQDGDAAAEAGRYEAALAAYDMLLTGSEWPTWTDRADEVAGLQAYARYRAMLTAVMAGQEDRARQLAALFTQEQGTASPSAEGFMRLGRTFWAAYETTRSAVDGCDAVTALAASDPSSYDLLNQFGYANRFYTPQDLCPFGS